jgi:hypothetical protein
MNVFKLSIIVDNFNFPAKKLEENGVATSNYAGCALPVILNGPIGAK